MLRASLQLLTSGSSRLAASQVACASQGLLHQVHGAQQCGIALMESQPSTSSSCSSRSFSAAAEESKPAESIGNEKVQQLAQEIMNLTVLESTWLSQILRKKLNIEKPAYGSMQMAMPMMAAPAAASAAAPAAAPAAPAVEEKKEKTEFEVKLESFTTEGKIKVIKEVRAITGLGLKEAKELVSACMWPR
jgi:large subunit ribosomal protein L7/L12